MSDFVLLTDSCCDLPKALVDEMQIAYVPLCVHMDENTYRNYLDEREISYPDFYARLPKIKDIKTSAVNQHEFLEIMEPVAASGKDFIYIGFSSGLSGTYSAGALAVQELQEKYPDRKLYAVDTLGASLGQGMLVYYAYLQQQAGKTVEEVYQFLLEASPKMCHWFTVNDLMHLKRGGRVSAATALVGSMLSIKPVMHVDDEGHLINVSKARGRKASLEALAAKVGEDAIEPEKQTMFISHGDCLEDAEYVAKILQEKYHVPEIHFNHVGPVIGSHTGPGVVAMFYFGKKR